MLPCKHSLSKLQTRNDTIIYVGWWTHVALFMLKVFHMQPFQLEHYMSVRFSVPTQILFSHSVTFLCFGLFCLSTTMRLFLASMLLLFFVLILRRKYLLLTNYFFTRNNLIPWYVILIPLLKIGKPIGMNTYF